ncbi:MAG: hypothetical protein JWO39_2685 [Gemmatimonadetes bacterium]|nr:hypothetical protein [Gemmatimonadota bacterium]
MQDLIGPDIRNSVFAHILHVLLIGGVIVYGWQAVTALVRKPTSVGRALRKAVYAAWLAVLLLILTKDNPVPFLGSAGLIAALLIGLALWDRVSAPAERKELMRRTDS